MTTVRAFRTIALAAAIAVSGAGLTACDPAPSLQVATIVSGLDVPWDLTFAPDGRMFFTERSGGISLRGPEHRRPPAHPATGHRHRHPGDERAPRRVPPAFRDGPHALGWDPVPGHDESTPMTDTAKFPNAVRAAWSSGNPTVATSGAAWLSGSQWGGWDDHLAVAALKDESLRILAPVVGRRSSSRPRTAAARTAS
jgi:glucose/arabinose dehydrogenase